MSLNREEIAKSILREMTVCVGHTRDLSSAFKLSNEPTGDA